MRIICKKIVIIICAISLSALVSDMLVQAGSMANTEQIITEAEDFSEIVTGDAEPATTETEEFFETAADDPESSFTGTEELIEIASNDSSALNIIEGSVDEELVGANTKLYFPLDNLDTREVRGFSSGHAGIDFSCTVGTPIYASCDGSVTFYQCYRTYSGTRYLTSYGNCVYLRPSEDTSKLIRVC